VTFGSRVDALVAVRVKELCSSDWRSKELTEGKAEG
jgi:hypothetical protein